MVLCDEEVTMTDNIIVRDVWEHFSLSNLLRGVPALQDIDDTINLLNDLKMDAFLCVQLGFGCSPEDETVLKNLPNCLEQAFLWMIALEPRYEGLRESDVLTMGFVAFKCFLEKDDNFTISSASGIRRLFITQLIDKLKKLWGRV